MTSPFGQEDKRRKLPEHCYAPLEFHRKESFVDQEALPSARHSLDGAIDKAMRISRRYQLPDYDVPWDRTSLDDKIAALKEASQKRDQTGPWRASLAPSGESPWNRGTGYLQGSALGNRAPGDSLTAAVERAKVQAKRATQEYPLRSEVEASKIQDAKPLGQPLTLSMQQTVPPDVSSEAPLAVTREKPKISSFPSLTDAQIKVSSQELPQDDRLSDSKGMKGVEQKETASIKRTESQMSSPSSEDQSSSDVKPALQSTSSDTEEQRATEADVESLASQTRSWEHCERSANKPSLTEVHPLLPDAQASDLRQPKPRTDNALYTSDDEKETDAHSPSVKARKESLSPQGFTQAKNEPMGLEGPLTVRKLSHDRPPTQTKTEMSTPPSGTLANVSSKTSQCGKCPVKEQSVDVHEQVVTPSEQTNLDYGVERHDRTQLFTSEGERMADERLSFTAVTETDASSSHDEMTSRKYSSMADVKYPMAGVAMEQEEDLDSDDQQLNTIKSVSSLTHVKDPLSQETVPESRNPQTDASTVSLIKYGQKRFAGVRDSVKEYEGDLQSLMELPHFSSNEPPPEIPRRYGGFPRYHFPEIKKISGSVSTSSPGQSLANDEAQISGENIPLPSSAAGREYQFPHKTIRPLETTSTAENELSSATPFQDHSQKYRMTPDGIAKIESYTSSTKSYSPTEDTTPFPQNTMITPGLTSAVQTESSRLLNNKEKYGSNREPKSDGEISTMIELSALDREGNFSQNTTSLGDPASPTAHDFSTINSQSIGRLLAKLKEQTSSQNDVRTIKSEHSSSDVFAWKTRKLEHISDTGLLDRVNVDVPVEHREPNASMMRPSTKTSPKAASYSEDFTQVSAGTTHKTEHPLQLSEQDGGQLHDYYGELQTAESVKPSTKTSLPDTQLPTEHSSSTIGGIPYKHPAESIRDHSESALFKRDASDSYDNENVKELHSQQKMKSPYDMITDSRDPIIAGDHEEPMEQNLDRITGSSKESSVVCEEKSESQFPSYPPHAIETPLSDASDLRHETGKEVVAAQQKDQQQKLHNRQNLKGPATETGTTKPDEDVDKQATTTSKYEEATSVKGVTPSEKFSLRDTLPAHDLGDDQSRPHTVAGTSSQEIPTVSSSGKPIQDSDEKSLLASSHTSRLSNSVTSSGDSSDVPEMYPLARPAYAPSAPSKPAPKKPTKIWENPLYLEALAHASKELLSASERAKIRASGDDSLSTTQKAAASQAANVLMDASNMAAERMAAKEILVASQLGSSKPAPDGKQTSESHAPTAGTSSTPTFARGQADAARETPERDSTAQSTEHGPHHETQTPTAEGGLPENCDCLTCSQPTCKKEFDDSTPEQEITDGTVTSLEPRPSKTPSTSKELIPHEPQPKMACCGSEVREIPDTRSQPESGVSGPFGGPDGGGAASTPPAGPSYDGRTAYDGLPSYPPVDLPYEPQSLDTETPEILSIGSSLHEQPGSPTSGDIVDDTEGIRKEPGDALPTRSSLQDQPGSPTYGDIPDETESIGSSLHEQPGSPTSGDIVDDTEGIRKEPGDALPIRSSLQDQPGSPTYGDIPDETESIASMPDASLITADKELEEVSVNRVSTTEEELEPSQPSLLSQDLEALPGSPRQYSYPASEVAGATHPCGTPGLSRSQPGPVRHAPCMSSPFSEPQISRTTPCAPPGSVMPQHIRRRYPFSPAPNPVSDLSTIRRIQCTQRRNYTMQNDVHVPRPHGYVNSPTPCQTASDYGPPVCYPSQHSGMVYSSSFSTSQQSTTYATPCDSFYVNTTPSYTGGAIPSSDLRRQEEEYCPESCPTYQRSLLQQPQICSASPEISTPTASFGTPCDLQPGSPSEHSTMQIVQFAPRYQPGTFPLQPIQGAGTCGCFTSSGQDVYDAPQSSPIPYPIPRELDRCTPPTRPVVQKSTTYATSNTRTIKTSRLSPVLFAPPSSSTPDISVSRRTPSVCPKTIDVQPSQILDDSREKNIKAPLRFSESPKTLPCTSLKQPLTIRASPCSVTGTENQTLQKRTSPCVMSESITKPSCQSIPSVISVLPENTRAQQASSLTQDSRGHVIPCEILKFPKTRSFSSSTDPSCVATDQISALGKRQNTSSERAIIQNTPSITIPRCHTQISSSKPLEGPSEPSSSLATQVSTAPCVSQSSKPCAPPRISTTHSMPYSSPSSSCTPVAPIRTPQVHPRASPCGSTNISALQNSRQHAFPRETKETPSKSISKISPIKSTSDALPGSGKIYNSQIGANASLPPASSAREYQVNIAPPSGTIQNIRAKSTAASAVPQCSNTATQEVLRMTPEEPTDTFVAPADCRSRSDAKCTEPLKEVGRPWTQDQPKRIVVCDRPACSKINSMSSSSLQKATHSLHLEPFRSSNRNEAAEKEMHETSSPRSEVQHPKIRAVPCSPPRQPTQDISTVSSTQFSRSISQLSTTRGAPCNQPSPSIKTTDTCNTHSKQKWSPQNQAFAQQQPISETSIMTLGTRQDKHRAPIARSAIESSQLHAIGNTYPATLTTQVAPGTPPASQAIHDELIHAIPCGHSPGSPTMIAPCSPSEIQAIRDPQLLTTPCEPSPGSSTMMAPCVPSGSQAIQVPQISEIPCGPSPWSSTLMAPYAPPGSQAIQDTQIFAIPCGPSPGSTMMTPRAPVGSQAIQDPQIHAIPCGPSPGSTMITPCAPAGSQVIQDPQIRAIPCGPSSGSTMMTPRAPVESQATQDPQIHAIPCGPSAGSTMMTPCAPAGSQAIQDPQIHAIPCGPSPGSTMMTPCAPAGSQVIQDPQIHAIPCGPSPGSTMMTPCAPAGSQVIQDPQIRAIPCGPSPGSTMMTPCAPAGSQAIQDPQIHAIPCGPSPGSTMMTPCAPAGSQVIQDPQIHAIPCGPSPGSTMMTPCAPAGSQAIQDPQIHAIPCGPSPGSTMMTPCAPAGSQVIQDPQIHAIPCGPSPGSTMMTPCAPAGSQVIQDPQIRAIPCGPSSGSTMMTPRAPVESQATQDPQIHAIPCGPSPGSTMMTPCAPAGSQVIQDPQIRAIPCGPSPGSTMMTPCAPAGSQAIQDPQIHAIPCGPSPGSTMITPCAPAGSQAIQDRQIRAMPCRPSPGSTMMTPCAPAGSQAIQDPQIRAIPCESSAGLSAMMAPCAPPGSQAFQDPQIQAIPCGPSPGSTMMTPCAPAGSQAIHDPQIRAIPCESSAGLSAMMAPCSPPGSQAMEDPQIRAIPCESSVGSTMMTPCEPSGSQAIQDPQIRAIPCESSAGLSAMMAPCAPPRSQAIQDPQIRAIPCESSAGLSAMMAPFAPPGSQAIQDPQIRAIPCESSAGLSALMAPCAPPGSQAIQDPQIRAIPCESSAGLSAMMTPCAPPGSQAIQDPQIRAIPCESSAGLSAMMAPCAPPGSQAIQGPQISAIPYGTSPGSTMMTPCAPAGSQAIHDPQIRAIPCESSAGLSAMMAPCAPPGSQAIHDPQIRSIPCESSAGLSAMMVPCAPPGSQAIQDPQIRAIPCGPSPGSTMMTPCAPPGSQAIQDPQIRAIPCGPSPGSTMMTPCAPAGSQAIHDPQIRAIPCESSAGLSAMMAPCAPPGSQAIQDPQIRAIPCGPSPGSTMMTPCAPAGSQAIHDPQIRAIPCESSAGLSEMMTPCAPPGSLAIRDPQIRAIPCESSAGLSTMMLSCAPPGSQAIQDPQIRAMPCESSAGLSTMMAPCAPPGSLAIQDPQIRAIPCGPSPGSSTLTAPRAALGRQLRVFQGTYCVPECSRVNQVIHAIPCSSTDVSAPSVTTSNIQSLFSVRDTTYAPQASSAIGDSTLLALPCAPLGDSGATSSAISGTTSHITYITGTASFPCSISSTLKDSQVRSNPCLLPQSPRINSSTVPYVSSVTSGSPASFLTLQNTCSPLRSQFITASTIQRSLSDELIVPSRDFSRTIQTSPSSYLPSDDDSLNNVGCANVAPNKQTQTMFYHFYESQPTFSAVNKMTDCTHGNLSYQPVLSSSFGACPSLCLASNTHPADINSCESRIWSVRSRTEYYEQEESAFSLMYNVCDSIPVTQFIQTECEMRAHEVSKSSHPAGIRSLNYGNKNVTLNRSTTPSVAQGSTKRTKKTPSAKRNQYRISPTRGTATSPVRSTICTKPRTNVTAPDRRSPVQYTSPIKFPPLSLPRNVHAPASCSKSVRTPPRSTGSSSRSSARSTPYARTPPGASRPSSKRPTVCAPTAQKPVHTSPVRTKPRTPPAVCGGKSSTSKRRGKALQKQNPSPLPRMLSPPMKGCSEINSQSRAMLSLLGETNQPYLASPMRSTALPLTLSRHSIPMRSSAAHLPKSRAEKSSDEPACNYPSRDASTSQPPTYQPIPVSPSQPVSQLGPSWSAPFMSLSTKRSEVSAVQSNPCTGLFSTRSTEDLSQAQAQPVKHVPSTCRRTQLSPVRSIPCMTPVSSSSCLSTHSAPCVSSRCYAATGSGESRTQAVSSRESVVPWLTSSSNTSASTLNSNKSVCTCTPEDTSQSAPATATPSIENIRGSTGCVSSSVSIGLPKHVSLTDKSRIQNVSLVKVQQRRRRQAMTSCRTSRTSSQVSSRTPSSTTSRKAPFKRKKKKTVKAPTFRYGHKDCVPQPSFAPPAPYVSGKFAFTRHSKRSEKPRKSKTTPKCTPHKSCSRPAVPAEWVGTSGVAHGYNICTSCHANRALAGTNTCLRCILNRTPSSRAPGRSQTPFVQSRPAPQPPRESNSLSFRASRFPCPVKPTSSRSSERSIQLGRRGDATNATRLTNPPILEEEASPSRCNDAANENYFYASAMAQPPRTYYSGATGSAGISTSAHRFRIPDERRFNANTGCDTNADIVPPFSHITMNVETHPATCYLGLYRRGEECGSASWRDTKKPRSVVFLDDIERPKKMNVCDTESIMKILHRANTSARWKGKKRKVCVAPVAREAKYATTARSGNVSRRSSTAKVCANKLSDVNTRSRCEVSGRKSKSCTPARTSPSTSSRYIACVSEGLNNPVKPCSSSGSGCAGMLSRGSAGGRQENPYLGYRNSGLSVARGTGCEGSRYVAAVSEGLTQYPTSCISGVSVCSRTLSQTRCEPICGSNRSNTFLPTCGSKYVAAVTEGFVNSIASCSSISRPCGSQPSTRGITDLHDSQGVSGEYKFITDITDELVRSATPSSSQRLRESSGTRLSSGEYKFFTGMTEDLVRSATSSASKGSTKANPQTGIRIQVQNKSNIATGNSRKLDKKPSTSNMVPRCVAAVAAGLTSSNTLAYTGQTDPTTWTSPSTPVMHTAPCSSCSDNRDQSGQSRGVLALQYHSAARKQRENIVDLVKANMAATANSIPRCRVCTQSTLCPRRRLGLECPSYTLTSAKSADMPTQLSESTFSQEATCRGRACGCQDALQLLLEMRRRNREREMAALRCRVARHLRSPSTRTQPPARS